MKFAHFITGCCCIILVLMLAGCLSDDGHSGTAGSTSAWDDRGPDDTAGFEL